MPKVDTMQQAIRAAQEFVSKYHPFREVRGAKKDATRYSVSCAAAEPSAARRARPRPSPGERSLMTNEELIIAAVRIAGALPVLRWAFGGALIAIGVDLSDLFMMNLLDLGGVRNYQALDKWLDVSYMLTFFIVALRWDGWARRVAVGLFALRVVGFVGFEASGERWVLMAFPNAFEFWVVFVAWVRHWRPAYELTLGRSLAWLVPVVLLKEVQEVVLHGWRGLDNFTAVGLVRSWWRWLTSPFD